MPTKKSHLAAIKAMAVKIDTLEENMGLKSTLTTMEKNQATLIAMFEKSLRKSLLTEDESVVNRGDPVELSMFDGGDPTGWISRAEVYFRVHDTIPEVKVNLVQL
ncbi:hypothetical protein L195_g057070, partial [Trifolium pratense]